MTFELRSVKDLVQDIMVRALLIQPIRKLEWSKGALSRHRTFNIQRCGSEKQLRNVFYC